MAIQAEGSLLSVSPGLSEENADFSELDKLLSNASEESAIFTLKLKRIQAIVSNLSDELHRKSELLKAEMSAHDETRKQLRTVQHELETVQNSGMRSQREPAQKRDINTEIHTDSNANAQCTKIFKLQVPSATLGSRLTRTESAVTRVRQTTRRAKFCPKWIENLPSLQKCESELLTAKEELNQAYAKLEEKNRQISSLAAMALQARKLQLLERKELCRVVQKHMERAESLNKSLRQTEFKLQSMSTTKMGGFLLNNKLRQHQWLDSKIEFESVTPTSVSAAKV